VPHEAIWFWERLQHEETRSNAVMEHERIERILTAVSEAGRIFTKLGGVWVVQGKNHRTLHSESRGILIINAILKNQREPMTPEQIEAKLPPPAIALRGDLSIDEKIHLPGMPEDRAAIDFRDEREFRQRMHEPASRAAIEELKGRLKEAKMNGDKAELTLCRKLLRLVGHGEPGRVRRPPDQQKEAPRNRVRKIIERTLAELRKTNAPTAAYIDKHLQSVNGRWLYDGEAFVT
jgi:hypothetical protein